ncbi:MAG: hypothetical protein RIG77_08610 [Cyclobacteriaceae bacterium]
MNKCNKTAFPIKIDGINSIQDREYFHNQLLKAIDILTDGMKNDHRPEYLEAIYYLNYLQIAISPHNEDVTEIVIDDVKCEWDFQLYNLGLTTAISLIIENNDGQDDIFNIVWCLSKLNKALTFTWGHVRNQRKMGVA